MEATITNQPRLEQNGTSFLEFKQQCSDLEFPNKFSDYVKNFGDLYYWPQGGFHVVTHSEMAKHVLKSFDFSADRGGFFISRMPNLDLSLIGNFFSIVKKMMVMSDGETHQKRRKAATKGFEENVLKQFESKVHQTIKGLLKQVANRPSFDFVEDIAKKLPSTVLADLFAIPERDRENFFNWSNCMTAFFGGAAEYNNEEGKKVDFAAKNLAKYFLKAIETRRPNPQDDYLSSLIKAQAEFDLTDEEIVSQAIMMLVAGQVTTTDQICNIMFALASQPELQTGLKEGTFELLPTIEELKRYDPAVTFLFRVAKKDMNFHGQPIKAGETVFISNHAVNRGHLNAPNKIDPTRKGQNHFAYGHGTHYCLGANLGRMQMNALFTEMIELFPILKFDESKETARDHYSLSFSGFKALHLRPDYREGLH